MSYLAFNTREREVHVRGWERHRLPGICQNFAWGLLGMTPASVSMERMEALLPEGHPLRDGQRKTGYAAQWAERYRLFFTQGDDRLIQWKGRRVLTYPVILNTVLDLGSDPMKLAARFAGQSYGHGWIDGPDRGWAADLITAGLLTDVFRMEIQVTDPSSIIPNTMVTKRHKAGWADVLELLREDDKGPVVLSVSTDDDFPNSSVLGVPYEGYEEILAEPNGNDQIWDLAELWLRNRHTGHKISEATHGEYRFDHRLSVWDLIATDYEARLDRALEEGRI